MQAAPRNSCPKRLRAKECACSCRLREWRASSRSIWDHARGLIDEEDEVEKWTEEKTEAFYRSVLGDAGRIANRSVSTGFEESRKRTFDEFRTFVKKVGRGLSVENARGIDVVAFVHGEWIPNHRKNFRTTYGSGDEKVASASAIRGVIGHIAKSYSMMGRADSENPAKEETVQSYRDGYRNELHDRGVREKRAKVMKESKVTDLVEYLTRAIGAAEGIAKCVLMMDRAAVLYLWESWARGKECGELENRQIDREEGIAYPGWSKTVRSKPSGRIELNGAEGGMSFLRGSAELMGEMGRQQIEEGKGYLFRPLNAATG
jgi:hypothetical protein